MHIDKISAWRGTVYSGIQILKKSSLRETAIVIIWQMT